MSNKIYAGPKKLLVVPVEEKKSAIYTGKDDDVPTQGTIVSVGCSISEGSWLGVEIIFKKYAGHTLTYGDTTYIALEPDQVLATIG